MLFKIFFMDFLTNQTALTQQIFELVLYIKIPSNFTTGRKGCLGYVIVLKFNLAFCPGLVKNLKLQKVLFIAYTKYSIGGWRGGGSPNLP